MIPFRKSHIDEVVVKMKELGWDYIPLNKQGIDATKPFWWFAEHVGFFISPVDNRFEVLPFGRVDSALHFLKDNAIDVLRTQGKTGIISKEEKEKLCLGRDIPHESDGVFEHRKDDPVYPIPKFVRG